MLFDVPIGDKKATEAAFAKAHAVAEVSIVNPRVITNFMETRAAVCEYDAKRDHLTLTIGSQGSHRLREILCGMVLKMPMEKMRVICPDVGGGFGTKLFPYREYALIAVAARKLRKTIKWTADRSDHFMGDAQGRDNVTTARMALAEDGKFLGMDVDLMGDMGAYLSTFGPYIPHGGAGMLPGLYDIQAFHCRVRTVFTNTVPVDAYRGAGRPEAAYVIERLVDAAARKLGMTPDAIRRKNFIPPKAMPYKTATGKVYDSGDFTAHMKRAMEVANWKEFPKRAKAAKKQGLVRGIGLGTLCRGLRHHGRGDRQCRARSQWRRHHPDRHPVERAGPPDRLCADWSPSSSGWRRSASTSCRATPTRSPPVSAPAARRRSRPAASASSAPPATLGRQSARDRRRGAGNQRRRPRDQRRHRADRRHRPLDQLRRSRKAAGRRSVEAERQRDLRAAPTAPIPNGTHLAEVEIDPATGIIKIVNYVIVDDFGVTLNPLLLAGQVHGGAMQGIGQALMEQAVYDRKRRPARHRHVHGLCAAARGRWPVIRVRDPQRALQDQSAGRQGRGRGGRDRLLSGGRQCDHRGAVARIQDRSHRHAGHRRAGLDRDPRAQRQHSL